MFNIELEVLNPNLPTIVFINLKKKYYVFEFLNVAIMFITILPYAVKSVMCDKANVSHIINYNMIEHPANI